MVEDENIYQKLWRIDLENNGCSVSGRDLAGNWVDPDADILVDEQNEFRGVDATPARLFYRVKSDVLLRGTYQAFIALLNNYIVNPRLSEDHLGDNAVEDAEIEKFIDLIIQTNVMKATFDFIRADVGVAIDMAGFRAALLRMWFEVYTNYFNDIPTPFASGFEHVMVGEGKNNGNGVGGYHSWIKFYLDEKSGRIDFRGFNYDNNTARSSTAGARFPHVATVAMTWTQKDIHGADAGALRKDLGGFFIGPSPELQIALGTVAYFESEAGRYDKEATGIKTDRKPVTLMGGLFHLVLYRNTLPGGRGRGDKIRSFWPKFIAPTKTEGLDVVIPIDHAADTIVDGRVRIIRAMANPQGSDQGGEWVELESAHSAIIDLNGWTLADRMDRRQALSGAIEPSKTRRIVLTRASHDDAQLGNKGGEIVLLDPGENVVARVQYGEASSGVVMHFLSKRD